MFEDCSEKNYIIIVLIIILLCLCAMFLLALDYDFTTVSSCLCLLIIFSLIGVGGYYFYNLYNSSPTVYTSSRIDELLKDIHTGGNDPNNFINVTNPKESIALPSFSSSSLYQNIPTIQSATQTVVQNIPTIPTIPTVSNVLNTLTTQVNKLNSGTQLGGDKSTDFFNFLT